MQTDLSELLAALLDCVTKLRSKTKDGAGPIPDGVLPALDKAIVSLHTIEGRMTGIRPEG